jgi:hypothetical protein
MDTVYFFKGRIHMDNYIYDLPINLHHRYNVMRVARTGSGNLVICLFTTFFETSSLLDLNYHGQQNASATSIN